MPNIGDLATVEDIPTGHGIALFSALEHPGDVLIQITRKGEPIAQVILPQYRVEEMARAILGGGLSIQ